MASRTLRVSEEVRALIRHLHPGLRKKVKAALQMILGNPDQGTPLRDELLGLRSVRVGRFRVIYRVTPTTVDLVAIGPRRVIYEETLRLLRREARQEDEADR